MNKSVFVRVDGDCVYMFKKCMILNAMIQIPISKPARIHGQL